MHRSRCSGGFTPDDWSTETEHYCTGDSDTTDSRTDRTERLREPTRFLHAPEQWIHTGS